MKRNKKTKIDWVILAETEKKSDKNNPECVVDYRTSGFSKYGFGGEVLVVGKVKDASKIADLINTFCKMMIDGEKFALGFTHCIDKPNGETKYRFNIVEYATLNNGVKYQLIPLFCDYSEINKWL